MMKKWWIIGVLAALLPSAALAQVEKQVEVTKAYVPSVGQATKMRIEPRMDDTVRMRPEIDYTVTPLSLETTLDTRPIRPAQISYEEFNLPSRFYLKAGAGAPLQSLVDFYASSAQAGRGYVTGYLQHEGRYGKLRNDFDTKRSALRMTNRLGAAAGRLFGVRLLEGDLHYRHRLDRRYGASLPDELVPAGTPGMKIGYSDVDLALRFGDDFLNLKRTNFELALDGSLFFDHSDAAATVGRGRQSDFGVRGRVGREFSGHRVTFGLGYAMKQGAKALDGGSLHRLHVEARYAKELRALRLEAGADYYYDRGKGETVDGRAAVSNCIFPYLRLEFDLGSKAFKPFVEIDGTLESNDFRSLTERNPYVGGGTWLGKSTANYHLRGGLTGHSANRLFNYRGYVSFTVSDDRVYWTLPVVDFAAPYAYAAGWFRPMQGRQTLFSIAGEATWRPVTALRIELAARLNFYNDEIDLATGAPTGEARFGVRYEGQRFRFGIGATAQSGRAWSLHSSDPMQTTVAPVGTVHVPFEVDLHAEAEWMVSGSLALFVEGRNLLCQELYTWPLFPEYGINGLIGVRWSF